MGFLQIQPPQGSSTEQGLSIITGPSPKYDPPQGIGTPVAPSLDNMLFNVSLELMTFNNTAEQMEFNEE